MHDFRAGDEFFLLNHDQLTGRPTINRQFLGGGLVAALLAELIMERRATVREGRVCVLDRTARGAAAGDFLVDSLAAQRTAHPVRTWTENLDETAYELVARRLVERRTVRRVRPRRLLGARKDLFPAASREAVQPLLWLDTMIHAPGTADVQRSVVAALLRAAEADHMLAVDLDRGRVGTVIAGWIEGLPPAYRALITGFEAAVVALSLSIRR